jgi:hypothetical protein
MFEDGAELRHVAVQRGTSHGLAGRGGGALPAFERAALGERYERRIDLVARDRGDLLFVQHVRPV